ncbi:hypothetical protein [Elizabethkingia anophelis]|uniref:hypothetical protein n=2 Tax=Elizabethkingia TaxID=308865 RepID=UPI00083FFEE6|nr:hypothetical protein [Elizabethkingia anophelis]OCW75085.1 hypothetical protein A4G24_08420 [Elizabethkingia anophelis]
MKIRKFSNAVEVKMVNKRVIVGYNEHFDYYEIRFKRLLEPGEPTEQHYKSEKLKRGKILETSFTVSEEAFLGLSIATNEYIRSNFFTEEESKQVGEITK